ncbi:hypothetical protein GCM10020001_012920 [Nonomuraea salmonea]
MRQAEVVVHGATSAGVCAAVAAARRGLDTVLLEPGRHVGGMTSGGLGYTDIGDARVLGGMAAEFRQAVADAYGVAPGHYAGPEPHVAEQIFLSWLEQAGVEVVFGAALRTVVTSGDRIFSAATLRGDYAGGVFVDASYEGDLMAAAGVSYQVGREDRALHGERFAGRREVMPGMHNFPPYVSPFRADGTLLPQVADGPMAEVGEGDGGVMSYGYRVCMSTAPDRIPFARRPGYDDEHWELGRRLFRHWREQGVSPRAGRLVGLEPNLPNGKADGNSLGPFSLSVLDRSAWAYPDAGPEERERIRLHHLHHAQDLLYFLSHDPEVPAVVRAELGRWGAARRRVRRHRAPAAPALCPRGAAHAGRGAPHRARPGRGAAASRRGRHGVLPPRHPRGAADLALGLRAPRPHPHGGHRGIPVGGGWRRTRSLTGRWCRAGRSARTWSCRCACRPRTWHSPPSGWRSSTRCSATPPASPPPGPRRPARRSRTWTSQPSRRTWRQPDRSSPSDPGGRCLLAPFRPARSGNRRSGRSCVRTECRRG